MKRIERLTIALVLLVACGLTVNAATSRPPKVRRVLSQVLADEQFVPGTRASLRIVTRGLTGLLSSRPLAGARVTVSLQAGKRKRVLFKGKSDRDGVTRAKFSVPDWPEGRYKMTVSTRARAGSNRVTQAVALKRTGRILLVTDKPIYQPGQLIHIRMLALNAYDLMPLAREKVLFEVQDPKGNKVFKKRLKTSAYGVAACDFQLASEINLGNYQVSAACENEQLAETTQKTLVVKKYVLPKFKVETDTDRAFYLPRQTIKGKIQSDYFFGKPVAGAQVEVKASTFDVEFKEFASLTGQTDENGHWDFEMKLPDYFVGQPVQKGDAVVKLDVKVTDSAKHTEKGVKTVPVAEAPIRLDAVPEGGRIVAGVQNMIYLVASYPDGSPAEAEVIMLRDGKQLGKVKTDPTGLGALPITPRGDELGYEPEQPHGSFGRDRRRFGHGQPRPVAKPSRAITLSFTAQDSKGARCEATKTFSTRSAKDRVLLRTDKAIYKSGDAIQVTLLTSDVGGTCFLDLIKNRQTLLTRSLPVAKGKGSVRLPLGSDIFGSLELSAYKILGNGEIMRDTRVLYVQPRRQLHIDVSQDKKVYRPGEEALIKFRVQDTRGRAVTAGMGVIIVDEAVYALQEIKPGLEKVYFTLEHELTKPKYQIEFGPSASLATLVKTERLQKQKQRVAKVLLAKALPLGKQAAWPNPVSDWLKSSRQKAQRDRGAIQNALYSFIRSQPAGRRTSGGGWAYRRDMVKHMIKTKMLPAKNSRGPFKEPYTAEEIEALWPDLAAGALLPPQQLERLRSLHIAVYRRLLEQSNQFADLSSDNLADHVKKAFDDVLAGGHSPAADVSGRKFRWADVDKLPAFRIADLIAEINQYRARRVYQALSSYGEQARPWSGWMRGRLDKKTNAFELPDDVLKRLIVLVLAREKDTRDAWGHAFSLKKMKAPRARAFFDYRLRFYELVSAGPDGKVGNSDDISFEYPAGDVGCESLALAFGGQAYCNLRETPALKGLPPPPPQRPMTKGGRRFKKMARMEERAMARPTAAGAPMPEATMKMDKEMQEGEAPGGSAGSGPAAPKKRNVRVRNFFPETLLFAPLLKTTNTGNVSLKVPLADSITTWRMTVSANAAAGGLGSTSHAVRVFQDFFVDLDLPVALTQNDELSIPVVVYNYLKTPQRVRLELASGDWFTLSGSPVQEIALEPNEVSSTYYRIKVTGLGDKTLQVRADGSNMSDAIRRKIEVLPDGKEINIVANGRLEGALQKTIDIPASAVPGASKILVRLYPGVFSQVLEGMESLLRLPGGCFEQTSSTAYPNVMALRYLRETGQVAPEIEMKATHFVNLGYQRLLNFESPSGGFNWWGNSEPGGMLLTGFGIQQFTDMGKVYEIDQEIIKRSKRWLAGKQNSDGSWNPTTHLHGYNMALGASKLRTSAYILWSLEQAGDKGGHIDRAVSYLTKHLDDAKGDLYTLALVANGLVLWNKSAPATLKLLAKLHDRRVVDEKEKTVSWPTKGDTAMYSRGSSAAVETTALVAMAMINAKRHTSDANGALTYLVKSKGAHGNWASTQATIFALKALLLGMGGVGGDADMSAEILVDGKRVGREAFNPDNSDVMRIIDAGAVGAGSHKVEIKSHGKANVMYQVVGRYYRPWKEVGGKAEPLTVKVEYDRRQLKVDDLLTAKVNVSYNQDRTTFMVIVDLGIPPGFSVIPDDFASLVSQGKIKRYSLTGRQITLYLGEMRKETPLNFSYKLKARFPIKAKTPKSIAYEYYTPSSRGVQQPETITVTE